MNQKLKSILACTAAFLLLAAAPVPAGAVTERDTEANVTFTPGSTGGLELLSAPTLNFGSHELSMQQVQVNAETKPANVQVYNGTSTAGWDVEAKLSAFQSGGADTLHGASITLYPTVAGDSGVTQNPPTAPASITLISADTDGSKIMSAEAGKGMGLWNAQFADETKAVLEVPQYKSTVGAHKATLSWTLSNTP